MKKDPVYKKAEKAEENEEGLLKNLKIVGSSSIDEEFLSSSTKLSANRRMILPKTYLHLWALGKQLQTYEYPFERVYKFFAPNGRLIDTVASFLVNTAGEDPVLIDTVLIEKDRRNLESVYFAHGYFDAKIKYKIDTLSGPVNKGKANVIFLIQEGNAYVIDSVEYNVENDYIKKTLENKKSQTRLKKGHLYNEENIKAERSRIATELKNIGYYKFSASDVAYVVDTSLGKTGVAPVKKGVEAYRNCKIRVDIPGEHKIFEISGVRFKLTHADIDTTRDTLYIFRASALSDAERDRLNLGESMLSDNVKITWESYYAALNSVNLNFLSWQIALREGSTYSLKKEKTTQRRLQELGIFRYVTIRYDVHDSSKTLDVIIDARLSRKFQLKTGVEVFSRHSTSDQLQRSNLPGFGGNVSLLDRKLFKGAERLELKARGNMSFYNPGEGEALRSFFEFGLDNNLYFPRMVLPYFDNSEFAKFNPTTVLNASFETQRRIEFDRTVFGLNWTYNWYHNSIHRKNRSSLSPYQVNFIQSNLSPAFEETINNITSRSLRNLIQLDFTPRFSSKFNYRFTHSDYRSTRERVTHFVEPSFTFGGNTPFLIDRFANSDGSFKDGKIGSVAYGQFWKFSTEYKVRIPLGKKTEVVGRAYSGIAHGWNYTHIVPFDARFFAGGTNSMRGWQSNTLGPGIFNSSDSLTTNTRQAFLISPGGEFILETNLEYRMHLINVLEIALFTDVGNVWFLPDSDFDAEKGKLSLATFRPGWDAGIGFRLDFSFFIFRLDLAHQLFVPSLNSFVDRFWTDSLGNRRIQLNFGIGYPF